LIRAFLQARPMIENSSAGLKFFKKETKNAITLDISSA